MKRKRNKASDAAWDLKRRSDPKRRAYMIAYLKAYRSKNAARLAAQQKDHYIKNKAYVVARVGQWQRDNPDKMKIYRERSAPKDRERTRKWMVSNPERYAQNRSRYYTENKDGFLKRNYIRRARIGQQCVDLRGIKKFMETSKSKEFCVCYYCQKKVPSSEIHFDHIVPIVNGGAHSVANLCVSCATCNLSKGKKSLAAWNRDGQTLFSI